MEQPWLSGSVVTATDLHQIPLVPMRVSSGGRKGIRPELHPCASKNLTKVLQYLARHIRVLEQRELTNIMQMSNSDVNQQCRSTEGVKENDNGAPKNERSIYVVSPMLPFQSHSICL